jgi:hypothetical protein
MAGFAMEMFSRHFRPEDRDRAGRARRTAVPEGTAVLMLMKPWI